MCVGENGGPIGLCSSWRPVPTLNVVLSNSYPLCYPFVYAVVYIYCCGVKARAKASNLEFLGGHSSIAYLTKP